MSLISMEFLIFVFAALAVYYLIPGRYQWIWLLGVSYVYYASSGLVYLIFIGYTTLVTYGAALLVGQREGQTGEVESMSGKGRRRALVLALLLVFGLLAVLKYTNFAIGNLNLLLHTEFRFQNFLLPLGISFYTFQSAGYIMDVYWKRCEPERNLFRFALFVSFFPQILQGPIGRYSRLARQFYEPHRFDFARIEKGALRILWGFFKKLVVAETAAVFVAAAFDEYQSYPGIALFGVLAYTAQLYGDFSGGMDVVIGVSILFGIELDENFKRPFFAVSITDFWHRWHITLGTWMKDYLFYPLSLSRAMGRFKRFCKKVFGRTYGRVMPICVSNLVVFFAVGIWHGPAWKFIVYGLYNGLIIAFSGLMAKNYQKLKSVCHVNDRSKGWKIFQIIRTFVLVNISWFFDRADTIPQALAMMKNAVTCFSFGELLGVHVGTAGTTYTVLALLILVVGCGVVLAVSFMQEKGISIQNALAARPWMFKWAVYLLLLFSIPMLGQPPDSTGGFIYAQF